MTGMCVYACGWHGPSHSGDPTAQDSPLARALPAATPGTGVRVTSATPAPDGAMPPGALQAFLRERAATHAAEGRQAPRGHWYAGDVWG